jgi:hypothetical protein
MWSYLIFSATIGASCSYILSRTKFQNTINSGIDSCISMIAGIRQAAAILPELGARMSAIESSLVDLKADVDKRLEETLRKLHEDLSQKASREYAVFNPNLEDNPYSTTSPLVDLSPLHHVAKRRLGYL